MKVRALFCKKCRNAIYSRARHDFHWCACGREGVFVDGGFDYFRAGGNFSQAEQIILDIPQTKKELFNDWNEAKDQFGMENLKFEV